MADSELVHLHVHSQYSLRDSIIKPDELIQRLKELGHNAAAITDHGEILGATNIFKEFQKAGLKYIHGCEMYICADTSVRDKDNKYHHLLVLCKDEVGRLNLNKLISKSEHPDNFYSKPRISFNMLQEHSEGLIVCSACLAGEIPAAIIAGDMKSAERIARKYKAHFHGDYYLEIQSRNDLVQVDVNKGIVTLSKSLGIPLVVTTDAHYVYEDDRKYQNKFAFNGKYKEDGESYVDCFIQSEQEVRDRLRYLPSHVVDEAIGNTRIIADRCDVRIPLSPPIMPNIETPKEFSSNKAWLMSLCREGAKKKLGIDIESPNLTGNIPEYISRLHYEIDSLERMGFIDYMLLVYSYASKGERKGPGRGSGGGSLICYLTDITDVDPIEHGLYFERFIDVGALDLLESGQITVEELKIPDIDLDFSGDSCNAVLQFLYNTYGESKVASIGKFSLQHTRGTIRDMCKVFGIDLKAEDAIAKSFENYSLSDVDMMINGEIPTINSAKDAITYVGEYTELFEYVRKLNGLPKSFGLHACGKIISTKDLDYFLPSRYDSNGVRYLQGDMHDVEDVGLVKIDVLGLRTLDHEYDALIQSGESGEFLNTKQDYTDEKTLDIFRSGDTVGIFQFSSFGMKKTLREMDVRGINDLAVANALYRPGAMQYIDSFCNRRSGKEEVEFVHPDLEPILADTHGIIVFQEQLIEIGRMAGLRNPDSLRQATGKKKPELLAAVKPELQEKLFSRGWSDTQFDRIWSDMLEFAHYSFNKSHACAYAIIAYMTAKLKAHYPAEFYAGLCNSYIGESSYVKDNADEILSDAYAHKVRIEPFNFRNDHRRCSVYDGKLIYAIPLLRDCNQASAEALNAIRDTTAKRFWEVLNSYYLLGGSQAQAKILIMLDFFSEFGTPLHLLKIQDMYHLFTKKAGQFKSQIRKDKIQNDSLLAQLVSDNGDDRGKKNDVLMSYRNLNVPNILNGCEEFILSVEVQQTPLKSRLAFQQEYIGFAPIASGTEEERPCLLVKAVYPAVRKSDGAVFGYNIKTTSLGSGISASWTVYSKQYSETPIQPGDIIYCLKRARNKSGYLVLQAYDKIA